MISAQRAAPRPATAKRTLLALAWPAAFSYLLTNAYRINDQFWIQGLGEAAQSATGAAMFVLIMNFSVAFLSAGGALSMVARAVGAGDGARVHTVTRHALGLSVTLGATLTVLGPLIVPYLVDLLGLDGQTAAYAREYLTTMYWLAVPLFLVPVLDNVFIGRGHTRIPMLLQGVAIGLNFLLNPLLIYGADVERTMGWVPGADELAGIAAALGLEGMGMRGAALATGLSRGLAAGLGLVLLRVLFDTRLARPPRPEFVLVRRMLSISAPISLSIAMYAGVYWVLLAVVFEGLPDSARAGLGIGFQVFEGVSYPLFLGLSMACASLVGRTLGAGDREAALVVVRNTREFATVLGLGMGAAFLLLGGPVGHWFTVEETVHAEIVLYVTVLAFSQWFVAMETIHEKVLVGSGETKRIPWITGFGNGVRIPLGYLLAIPLGLGSAGVYWAITGTSALKAGMFWWQVRRGSWLERVGSD